MTTDTKVTHTPAPWFVVQGEDATEFHINTDPRPEAVSLNVATAWGGGDEMNATVPANARLIAAAPDLLAVAKQIQNLGERLLTGELDPPQPPHYKGSFALSELLTAARAAIAKAEGGGA
jgi:hypothetical protein